MLIHRGGKKNLTELISGEAQTLGLLLEDIQSTVFNMLNEKKKKELWAKTEGNQVNNVWTNRKCKWEKNYKKELNQNSKVQKYNWSENSLEVFNSKFE